MKKPPVLKGTCQLCGAVAELIGSQLTAEHDAASTWAIYQSSCAGSKQEPYELGYSLIEPAYNRTRNAAQGLLVQSTRVRLQKDVVWVREALPAAMGEPIAQQWIHLPSTHLLVQQPKVIWNSFFRPGAAIAQFISATGLKWSHAALVEYLNGCYADHLADKAAGLANYANWLGARLADWEPRKLKKGNSK